MAARQWPFSDFERIWLVPKASTRVSDRTPFLIDAEDMGDHWRGFREATRWKGSHEWKKVDWDVVSPPANADELSRPIPVPDQTGPVLECKLHCGSSYRVSERGLDRDPDYCEFHQPAARSLCTHSVSVKLPCEACRKHFGANSHMRLLLSKRRLRRR